MATHSNFLAWRIPVDRRARWATVHGAAELDATGRLSTAQQCWVCVAARAFSSCSKQGCRVLQCMASNCGGFSCCREQALGRAGSGAVVRRLSCPTACGLFPDQKLNPCPLHWQGDSYPLDHQESPILTQCKGIRRTHIVVQASACPSPGGCRLPRLTLSSLVTHAPPPAPGPHLLFSVSMHLAP